MFKCKYLNVYGRHWHEGSETFSVVPSVSLLLLCLRGMSHHGFKFIILASTIHNETLAVRNYLVSEFAGEWKG